MPRKVTTTVYITQKQSAELGLLSAATGRPIAEFIREGVDAVIDKHGDPASLGGQAKAQKELVLK